MEQQEKIFDGAIINGREFPFIRVTVAKQVNIIKKFRPTIRGVIARTLFPSSENKRSWIKIRNVAFVKTGLWKWLRIVPKELRCSEIQLKLAGELQASFFARVSEEVKEHDRHLLSAKGSPTEKQQEKSQA